MRNLSKQNLIAAVCGLVAGVLFAVIASSISGGILVMFLPIIPLAIPGLAFSARHVALAALISSFVIGVISGGDYAITYIIIIAIPVVHFIRKILLHRGYEGDREWYPVLEALTQLTAIAASAFMFFCLITVHSEHAELKTLIAKAMTEQIDAAEPSVSHYMRLLANDWSFLVFACLNWLWVLCVYLFVYITNAALKQNHLALRNDLAITREGLPLWLPVVVLITALMAILGKGNDKFVGQAEFLILLLPYFLSGVASVHTVTANWRNGRYWIAGFYLLLIVFPWAAVLLVAKGMHTQTEAFLKDKKDLTN